MAAYEKAHIDEIASNQWPHWIPVRHHFGIETFGINIWRVQDDGTVIPEHDESASGAPELYYVVEGQATFTVAGDEVDAPAGTCVWVTDPERQASWTRERPGHARPLGRCGSARYRRTRPPAGIRTTSKATSSPGLARYARRRSGRARWPSGSSKPVRSCSPRLGRFDSGAAP